MAKSSVAIGFADVRSGILPAQSVSAHVHVLHGMTT